MQFSPTRWFCGIKDIASGSLFVFCKMFVSWLRMLLDIFPMVGKIVGDKLASEIVEKMIRRIGEAYYNVLERYCEEPDLAPESFEEIFKEQIEKICQSN